MRGWIRVFSWSFLVGLLMLISPGALLGQTSPQLRTVLNRLAGEWKGDVAIHTLDGRDLGSFGMSRRFVWSGDVLEWESILLLPSGEHRSRGRYFVRLGRLYATISRPGQPAQDYTGELSQGGIYWISALRDNRDLTEAVTSSPEGQVLELDSYEVLGLDDFPGVIRIQAQLRLDRIDLADESAARQVRTGTEWLGPSDPMDVLRTYAPPADPPVEAKP